MKIIKNLVLMFTLMFLTITCSHGPAVQDFPATASATDEVNKFNNDLKLAIDQQVNVLSPKNFRQAEDSLAAAQKNQNKKNDGKDTLHLIAQGRAYLTRANEIAAISHTNMEEVIVARKAALTAGAPEILNKEFLATDDKFKDATADIEKNSLENALENRSALQLQYLSLELRAIKYTNLSKPQGTINQAIKEGAREFAPRSLAIADKNVQSFEAFITANRHETNQIALRAAETQKSADHLLKITRSSKSGNKTTSEDMALKMENEQNKVADKQSQLNDKVNQLNTKEAEIASGALANQALSDKNESLESDQAFNERFEAARKQFNEKEAEVYKQGNTLLIRLKGLEFPSSQAGLKGSNFPLLTKVQNVIKSFGKGAVMVEGHTDSNGGKALNERLSTERASAVKEYLASNLAGEPVEIQSQGLDYQKPLATNKTAEGRAKNRRVDVLITAEKL